MGEFGEEERSDYDVAVTRTLRGYNLLHNGSSTFKLVGDRWIRIRAPAWPVKITPP